MITPQTLLPHCKQLWSEASSMLPENHVKRWLVSRTIGRHGTRSTVLYWAIWDRRCTPHGIDHRYLGWNLNYDPERYYNPNSDWRLQLYCNTIRLYRHGDQLRTLLPQELRAAAHGEFKFLQDDHSVQLVWDFSHVGQLETLAVRIAPSLVRALTRTASVFDTVFSIIATPQSGAENVAFEGSTRPMANLDLPSFGGKLSRSINARLRSRVVEAYGRRCHICGEQISLREEVHIDHVIPWSAGGLTELTNLRPAHALCNLRKGGRQ